MTPRRRRSLHYQTESRSQEKSHHRDAIERLHPGTVEHDSPSSACILCPMRETAWAAQTATCLRLTHSHHDHTLDMVHYRESMAFGQIGIRCSSVERSQEWLSMLLPVGYDPPGIPNLAPQLAMMPQ